MRTQRHISAWLVALVIACTPAGTEPASEAATTSPQSLSQSLITNTHPIEGYASKLSAHPGENISFSIHSPVNSYSVEIRKYGTDAGPQVVAGPFQCSNGAPRSYSSTSYRDGLDWPVSFSLSVPIGAGVVNLLPCSGSYSTGAWTSGIYVARLSATNNPPFDITFIVKDASGSEKKILVLASTNTWQAYNYWPGRNSFYTNPPQCPGWAASTSVHFRRPNPYATPDVRDDVASSCDYTPIYRTEHLAAGEVRLARWLARNGYSYSMLTDYDVQTGWNETTGQTAFDPFDVVVISTHSEYWSDEMYKSISVYLARGGNVITVSGNTLYRRVTLNSTTGSMVNTGTLWDDVWQAPAGWPDFVSKRRLFGIKFGGGTTTCQAFRPTAAAKSGSNKLPHWSFAGISSGALLGFSGEIASPSTRCAGGTSGASGEETDVDAPGFAREFTVLGQDATGFPSSIVHLRRPSAGQVFTIGSITAGASLALGDAPLTSLLRNVLARLHGKSFSDFQRDGHTDLIGKGASDGKLWLFKGNGQGGLTFPGTAFDAGWSTYNTVVSPGDFDSDGNSDLLARSNDGRLFFYRGTGSGTLVQVPGTQIATGWGSYVDIITPGDFDGDGRPDVLGRASDGTLWLYRGNGTGGFASPAFQIDAGWQGYVEVMSPGDFDEDGHPDLIARKSNGTLWFYRGAGDGTLVPAPGVQFETGWGGYNKLVAGGDFDGDGHGDVLARSAGGTLFFYRGKGDGTLVQQPGLQVGAAGAFAQFSDILTVW